MEIKRGRPKKMTPELKKIILKELENGCSEQAVKKAHTISAPTWTAAKKEDEEWAQQIEAAKHKAIKTIENVLFKKAKSGAISAIIYWLSKQAPHIWGDRVMNNEEEHGFKDLQGIHTRQVDEIIERFYEEYDKRGGNKEEVRVPECPED